MSGLGCSSGVLSNDAFAKLSGKSEAGSTASSSKSRRSTIMQARALSEAHCSGHKRCSGSTVCFGQMKEVLNAAEIRPHPFPNFAPIYQTVSFRPPRRLCQKPSESKTVGTRPSTLDDIMFIDRLTTIPKGKLYEEARFKSVYTIPKAVICFHFDKYHPIYM